MMNVRTWSCCLWAVLLSVSTTHADGVGVLEPFTYSSAKEASQAWTPRNGSPPPQLDSSGGLRFEVPFRKNRDRVYWDREVRLDLTRPTSFELELSCSNPGAIRRLGLYFKSGNGWLVCNKAIPESGRVQLVFPKKDFTTEGAPAGWHQVEAIRLSPWKGASESTALVAHRLSAVANGILLIKGTISAPDEAERRYAGRVTDRISRWLTDLHISHGIITDDDVRAKALANARVAVLCYNPEPPSAELESLRAFVAGGGKLLVFYSASPALAELLGMKIGPYLRTETPGRWSSFSFTEPNRWHTPDRVVQESMNIRPVYPTAHHAAVAAYWENMDGKRGKDPAWVVSDRGAWMTHVLLEGDAGAKQQMLLALLGHYEPALWAPAAQRAMDRIGRIGPFAGLAPLSTYLHQHARGSGDADRIEGLLERVGTLQDQVARLYEKGHYPDVVVQADKVRADLLEAYARAQSTRQGEFRGAWEHDGVGWYPGDWQRSCKRLAAHGMTAVLPNMLWGGLAHYPSKVLPPSVTFRRYGDQMAACLEAAHANQLEVHVWMVCWNLQGAPEEFVLRMRKEGRVQVDHAGHPTSWLNPAHPANRRLAINALGELVERYEVDGIHLDYVRYPGAAVDYSAATRAAFEAWLGKDAKDWPASAEAGGALAHAYRRFRADQITLFVRGVHKQVRPLRPALKISAAVFKNYPECVDSVGQDWGQWLKEGLVDFVTPMDYTADTPTLRRWVRTQRGLENAAGRIYPGLGVTANESELRADQVIDQIAALRELGVKGWVLFDMSQTLREETLPALSLGLTKNATP